MPSLERQTPQGVHIFDGQIFITMIDRKEGIVKEALPGLKFRIDLGGGGAEVLAHLAGKMRLNNIRVLPGDRVLLELGPDGKRGRIVRRL